MSQTLKQLAQAAGNALSRRNYRLVTAESCTGGGIGYWMTAIPGSSAWYERGFITYSNQAKMDLLQVPAGTIADFGAVSRETAIAMAIGALSNSRADISLATTGIAGPDGGTAEKPVGTVWLAFSCHHHLLPVECHSFSGDRHEIREKTIVCALKKLLEIVQISVL